MDCRKVGELIFNLRKEKNMTQKQLADIMNISDKTISKWERGLGCPDVSLLGELSEILGVNIEGILSGELDINGSNGGNMKQIKFFVCPSCGSVVTNTGEAEISCCGRKLVPQAPKPEDNEHKIVAESFEDDHYITILHEMSKSHYISFAAYVMYDKVLLMKLYPEQSPELRFPKMYGGKLYFYCNKHGLWERRL